jgi:hypothetical protein
MGSLMPKKKKASFDMSAADYRQAVKDRTDSQRNAANELLRQLEDQRKEDSPSLAAAQLKSASGKNLSQLLAASAARRGSSPLSQVMGLGIGAQAGRDLTPAATEAGLAESQQRVALASKLGIGQQQQDIAQIMEPGKLLAQAEKQRFEADAERNRQLSASKSAMTSGIIGAAGKMMSSYMGGSSSPWSGGTTGTATYGAGNAGGSGSSVGGGATPSISPYFGAEGGIVPGYAEGGDNYENDVVDAKLSPGEIVLPRSVTKHKNAPKKAKQFVEALLEQRAPKKEDEVSELSEAEIMRHARQQAIMTLLGKVKR